MSAQTLLTKTETAISGLLDAIADPFVEEYQIGGRRLRRPDFPRMMAELRIIRRELQREVARSNTSPVRLASFGRPTGIDR